MIKKVLKFGGTSVGTIERIQHVANIIKKEQNSGNKLIVVVSAMAGKTNELIKLSNEISDKFINDTECQKIQDYVYKFTYWFNENEFSDLLTYREINIGRLYQDELLNFFVRFLKKFKEIKNIINQNKDVEFFADNELFKIINFFTESCKNIGSSSEKIHAFTHEEIKIGLKIGKNQKDIFLDEKKYLKIKNLADKFISNFMIG